MSFIDVVYKILAEGYSPSEYQRDILRQNMAEKESRSQ